jgi:phage shock protein C
MEKIYLSRTDRKIAGVLGGIAERFHLDTTLLRLGVIFIALVTGLVPAIFTYLIACLIIPTRKIQP